MLRIAFGRTHPTSGDQNTIKTALQPLFAKKALGPLCIMHIHHLTFYGPSQYLSSFPSNGPKSINFRFSLISLSVRKKSIGLVYALANNLENTVDTIDTFNNFDNGGNFGNVDKMTNVDNVVVLDNVDNLAMMAMYAITDSARCAVWVVCFPSN